MKGRIIFIDLYKLIQEKLKYAVLVYSLHHLQNVSNKDITFTINNSNFLEMLLLRIRGETIKYATYRKR